MPHVPNGGQFLLKCTFSYGTSPFYFKKYEVHLLTKLHGFLWEHFLYPRLQHTIFSGKVFKAFIHFEA